MEQSLRAQFITRLEAKYGPWDKSTSRFGTTPFGTISKDLSISASQFSKLISGTATEGMYVRSIENINRLILNESIQRELQVVTESKARLEAQLERLQSHANRRYALFGGLLLLLLGLASAGYLLLRPANRSGESPIVPKGHPLAIYFDQEFNANFQSPYLDISEVQEFCPCNAYEGTWSLDKQYKLPLPGSRRPGLFYLAKSADVRMKCSRYDTVGIGKGRVLTAYEYLINEIWLDTKMRPLSPKYFDMTTKAFTPEFEQLDFAEDPDFKRVAVIHSFFTDKFEIYPDSIVRKGEPCGRYASDLDTALIAANEIDLRFILENVLGDLTTTACSATANPYCNPNDLQEGKSISFSCLYTITSENLGIGGGYPYEKGYRLEEQHYADNLICDCPE